MGRCRAASSVVQVALKRMFTRRCVEIPELALLPTARKDCLMATELIAALRGLSFLLNHIELKYLPST